MNRINSYIDRCIIDEYANKSSIGYSLDIDNLPDHEINNLLTRLMQADTNVRDFVRSEMQRLIDERLPEVAAEDRYHAGVKTHYLSNGDTYTKRIRGAA